MRRRNVPISKPDISIIDGALAAMSAEELRELVLGILPWLDDKTHARMVNEIINRVARGESGWTPRGPTEEDIAEILNFAESARRVGYADPSEIDDYLRQGMNAFLSRDYRATLQIFRALLIPISEAEIDLGQHEMVDEVLGVEVADCATQYLVAMYMTASPKRRARVVRAAIDDMRGAGHFWQVLREMERVAVEPLDDFDHFLHAWRDLVQRAAAGERSSEWDTDEDRWLREVVHRLEGADGLAEIARSTRRSDDLQAWCRALVDAGDWKAALAAYDEAAKIVTDKTCSQGSFLDGAALAAQELGRKDLPKRLKRAWQKDPSLLRLRRWLGSSGSKTVLKRRAAVALEACPSKARRQGAFLHVLLGDFTAAAKLLASAPGLGWSNSEHPGHLLFPVFCALLSDSSQGVVLDIRSPGVRGMDIDELESLGRDSNEPHLSSPSLEEIIRLAGVTPASSKKERSAMLGALRVAAEKRIEGVTNKKRRRYYGHAAQLVAACVAVDESPDTQQWEVALRNEYRRYPALQRELNDHLGLVVLPRFGGHQRSGYKAYGGVQDDA